MVCVCCSMCWARCVHVCECTRVWGSVIVRVNIYKHLCAGMYVAACICVCICVCASAHVHVCVCVYVQICSCMRALLAHVQEYMPMHI